MMRYDEQTELQLELISSLKLLTYTPVDCIILCDVMRVPFDWPICGSNNCSVILRCQEDSQRRCLSAAAAR